MLPKLTDAQRSELLAVDFKPQHLDTWKIFIENEHFKGWSQTVYENGRNSGLCIGIAIGAAGIMFLVCAYMLLSRMH